MMDLDSFLVSLYVLTDDWWRDTHSPNALTSGRPSLISEAEILMLAILAQWPRFRSERDFWRFASEHLRPYFPNLCTQSQFNRRVRALELELRALQQAFAGEIAEPSAVYRHLGNDPGAGRGPSKGFSQGALLRTGELRKERLQD